ncbi:MAG: hypothetical protein IKD09_03440, partial [Lentisphaeria bacterium]|nr:hypothetical protein [Lentisphaeria bacterium]
ADHENIQENVYRLINFNRENNWLDVYKEQFIKYTDGVEYNHEVYQKVFSDFWHYIDCESRIESRGLNPVHWYLNKFNMLYRFIYAVLVKENIELCLFSNLNHLGADLLIYNIAKAMGIKTLFFTQGSMPGFYDRVFYMTDNSDYGDFTYMQRKFEESNYQIKQTTSDDIFYMKPKKKTFRDFKRSLPFYKPEKYGKLREYKQRLSALFEDVDYSRKYVYFAMHLQPELTTSCLGGIYCDQLLALERLSELIPDDWVIYAKENPGQNERMRDESFFQQLSFIPKVKVAPLTENSLKLILGSQFVSTITGTVGYEALCAGKKALVFGSTWYQNFEGAVKWRDDLTLDEIMSGSIDIKKLEKDQNELLSRMPYGVIDLDYVAGVKNYDENKSINSMTQVVIDCINEMKECK